jgi:hypothetical protein
MQQPRYVTKLLVRSFSKPNREGLIEFHPLKFNSKGKPIFNPESVRSFEFSIHDTLTNKAVAHIGLGKFVPNVPTIYDSKVDEVAAVNFFKTYKQSPFRLLFFASLSFLEKIGDNRFVCDEGEKDKGRAHKKQLRERLFFHTKPKSERGVFHNHALGFFPKLSFAELDKILAANKPVPHRLLPPESVLRKKRVRSYATLMWRKTKKDYAELRRKLRVKK